MAAPNFVLIITDTQNRSMVGAYGDPRVETPAIDRLAAGGLRFDRAYTTCPLCTPARGALFTGLHPQVNGAWCNNQAPGANIAAMGTIFRHLGYRAAYTGKWHLDGSGYFGDGEAGGGFEPDWWYDGKCYAADLGAERFKAYTTARTAQDLRSAGFSEEWIWGKRVADRAVDFLENVQEGPFLLVVSFDEPHGPYVTPPEYWEKFAPRDIPRPPNYSASLEGKPEMQRIHHQELHHGRSWEEFSAGLVRFFGCNHFIDRQIGRVIEAVDRMHGQDTYILYTSDHGDMLGAHGLVSKGPMMYEEVTNIPLIVRGPNVPAGAVDRQAASHIDLLPTMLDLAGQMPTPMLHGSSLAQRFTGQPGSAEPFVYISYHRYAINHDNWGGFYPIRCVTDGRYKLAINLFDLDEFYDLQEDPLETQNRIDDPTVGGIRDDLHTQILQEMDRTRDPFRSFEWADRPWHRVVRRFYWGGQRRSRPPGFAFQPQGLEASD